ncbi:MAG: hypothetical protein F6K40_22815 [Okeania sp. SIO3I5]|uniref:hypothetical protein n=1 Tax=Okeania sp. SIO3I5 TaxID=2607805 RepID=UPI0013B72FA1|nr:hypothetical protein [Okeania sp. SIO3I5]NEQ38948.1 hypothetical protein [Okeania sp. SIO3I5]
MMSNKSITAFFMAASLIFSSCTAVQIKKDTLVLSLISAITEVQKVKTVTLDVEKKMLVVQTIQENGELTEVTIDLTKRQLEKIMEKIIQTGGKLEIPLGNEKKVVIQVVDKTPSNLSPKLENIIKHLNERKYVAYSDESGKFSGKITEFRVRQQQDINNSTVAAIIDWDDGVVSSILFKENSRVRVWVAGIEYGGKWYWDSTGYLSIKMDAGSKYRF